uniref:Uncharacterized protein n=1 Tax=Anguilla anguilla TaxID=7936 RepID=A0A0E9UEF6_ANGAN
MLDMNLACAHLHIFCIRCLVFLCVFFCVFLL